MFYAAFLQRKDTSRYPRPKTMFTTLRSASATGTYFGLRTDRTPAAVPSAGLGLEIRGSSPTVGSLPGGGIDRRRHHGNPPRSRPGGRWRVFRGRAQNASTGASAGEIEALGEDERVRGGSLTLDAVEAKDAVVLAAADLLAAAFDEVFGRSCFTAASGLRPGFAGWL